MSFYWNTLVRGLKPYVPGEQPKDQKYIKLNTNENPYPPSPQALSAIQGAVNADLRLYPDPTASKLRQALAEQFGLPAEQFFVGNGSDEVLAMSFMTFFSKERPVQFADISYSFYKVYADLCRLQPDIVPLSSDFSVPVDAFCARGKGVVLPNPNAPTGRLLALTDVRRIIEADLERVVLIDEAYIDFGGTSVVPLIADYPNVLVVRTLSKCAGLAGLRVGFAVGSAELIEGLNRLKNSFNSYTLDRLALAGSEAAIADTGYIKGTAQRIIATRTRVTAALQQLDFTVIPSAANFIFIAHASVSGARLFSQLRERGILVRHFNDQRIANYLRVSIGTDEEMDAFLKAIKALITEDR
ncbi:MAG: histidinol-phosphate transaminase [Sporolactobacillus sp.]